MMGALLKPASLGRTSQQTPKSSQTSAQTTIFPKQRKTISKNQNQN
jgi:hypothetical protein